MICPACGGILTRKSAGTTTVDACVNGCGGIWFDNFELERFDDPADADAAALLQINASSRPIPEGQDKRLCPRCGIQPMRRHFYSRKRSVQIDTCPACAGVWLDAGELARIREEIAGRWSRNS